MKVCIVGGGASGWWTAAYLEKNNPDLDITLVESDTIPTLGVGEAVQPAVRLFIEELGIDEAKWMQQASATIKKGSARKGFQSPDETEFYKVNIAEEGSYGYHVDNSQIYQIVRDSTKNINHIVQTVTSKSDLPKADLYIDCTGFRRALIEDKTLVCDPDLTVNTAIVKRAAAEDTPCDGLTRIIARKYGWEFNIHLADGRAGIGYVFDRNYISIEEAKEEYEQNNSHRQFISDYNVIQWTPGVLENPWQGDTVALGVAAGFIEPQEATGLAVLVYQIKALSRALKRPNGDKFYRKAMYRINQQSSDIIWNIYAISRRDDTEFWKKWAAIDPTDRLNKSISERQGKDQTGFMFGDYLYRSLGEYGKWL